MCCTPGGNINGITMLCVYEDLTRGLGSKKEKLGILVGAQD